MNVKGVSWIGVRSAAYPGLRRLFTDVLAMRPTREVPGVTWYELPNGEEIQIYDDRDADHAFFGSGPVVGFEVDDVAEAVVTLEAAGIELIGPGDEDEHRRWQHFRGPDGNVYEVIRPR